MSWRHIWNGQTLQVCVSGSGCWDHAFVCLSEKTANDCSFFPHPFSLSTHLGLYLGLKVARPCNRDPEQPHVQVYDAQSSSVSEQESPRSYSKQLHWNLFNTKTTWFLTSYAHFSWKVNRASKSMFSLGWWVYLQFLRSASVVKSHFSSETKDDPWSSGMCEIRPNGVTAACPSYLHSICIVLYRLRAVQAVGVVIFHIFFSCVLNIINRRCKKVSAWRWWREFLLFL